MRLKFALVCSTLAFGTPRGFSADEPTPVPVPAVLYPADSEIDAILSGRDHKTGDGFYGSHEFLLWQIKSSPVAPTLVTTASFADPLPGAIGQAGTRVVLGANSINTSIQPGVRLMLGYRTELGVSVEGTYIYSETSTNRTVETSGLPGSPNLAVPIFDVSGVSGLNGIPGQSVFVLPGPFGPNPAFRGVFQLGFSNQLQGGEINATTRFGDWGSLRVDGLAGFRWLQLHENLTFTAATIGLPGSVVAGAFVNTWDSFKTRNDFFGGQVGLRSTYEMGRWSLAGTAKIAIGGVMQSAAINGASETSNGNLFLLTKGTAGQVLPSGVFAQASNIGSYYRDVLSYLPEATVNLGYQLTNHFKVFVGYNFLYLGNVVHPGDVIDPNINVTRTDLATSSRATVGTGTGPIPFGSSAAAPAASGAIAPNFHFNSSDVWVQGINFGVAGRY